MSSACLRTLAAFVACVAIGAQAAAARELRVCADPDDLPYSNAAGAGFENRISELVAADLHAELRYTWAPLQRAFVRKTMGEGLCDVFIGVPASFERVLTTRPYYRSSYVFVSRGAQPVTSFDDPRLARVHVGVQLIGNDLAATPPGHALAARGATDNVEGFTLMGERPAAARMVDALVQGRIETALVWGPQAGYFAARAPVPLHIDIAHAPAELADLPFEFAISMGVARGNRALRDALDGVLARRAAEIDAILAAYHVPRTDRP